MRSMWKGALSFGLVNVPVKLYAATEDHDVRFHQVHAADGGRIRMKRVCSVCGETVEYKDLAKAYEADDGRVVVMQDEDFANLPVPGTKEIEIVEFVPSDQVDPLLFDRSYYLEPDGRSVKPYVLMREALEQTDRTAITKVVLRNKQQLAALRVRGDVLVLQTMLWPDELRAADFDVLGTEVEVRPQELAMAASLIENLSADFEPAQYADEYREALLAVIEDKLAGGRGVQDVVVAGDQDEGAGLVVDLMAALRESVERTRAERAAAGDGTAPAGEPAAAAAPRRRTRATAAADGPDKPAARRSGGRTATASTGAAAASPEDAAAAPKPARRRRTA